nr:MAG TPA: hypothetical protein [Caudoviricetes sp.]
MSSKRCFIIIYIIKVNMININIILFVYDKYSYHICIMLINSRS